MCESTIRCFQQCKGASKCLLHILYCEYRCTQVWRTLHDGWVNGYLSNAELLADEFASSQRFSPWQEAALVSVHDGEHLAPSPSPGPCWGQPSPSGSPPRWCRPRSASPWPSRGPATRPSHSEHWLCHHLSTSSHHGSSSSHFPWILQTLSTCLHYRQDCWISPTPGAQHNCSSRVIHLLI